MFGYTVRLARATEVDCLPEIERLAARRFVPYLDRLEIPAELLEGLTPVRFLRRAQAERRLWVALADSRALEVRPERDIESDAEPDAELDTQTMVVGFIVAKFLLGSCFVVELDVHPDFGRRGIGSALVEACCAGARSRGVRWVTLTTFRYIPWNIPFYEGLGFEVLPAEQWPPEIRAIVEHEHRYGFATKHRAVMRRRAWRPAMPTPLSGRQQLGRQHGKDRRHGR
ncbi:MAG: GNAT family N-acetyltransferase [Cyanobacteria bacterium J06606_4]